MLLRTFARRTPRTWTRPLGRTARVLRPRCLAPAHTRSTPAARSPRLLFPRIHLRRGAAAPPSLQVWRLRVASDAMRFCPSAFPRDCPRSTGGTLSTLIGEAWRAGAGDHRTQPVECRAGCATNGRRHMLITRIQWWKWTCRNRASGMGRRLGWVMTSPPEGTSDLPRMQSHATNRKKADHSSEKVGLRILCRGDAEACAD